MPSLDDLALRNPEWAPWLAVVRTVHAELGAPGWEPSVPRALHAGESGVPLLSGARFCIDAGTLRRLMAELPALERCSDALALFETALNGDDERLGALAEQAGADPALFSAVAALLPRPLLHACQRRWSGALPRGWRRGYCPLCGNWPAMAEVCGVERSRYLRCAACGAAWAAHALSCPYCAMADHEQLASLVPQQGGSGSAIEACKRCLGYLKAFTRLRLSPAEALMPEDLASVELDLVAAERGYRRPPGQGRALHASCVERGAAQAA